MVALYVCILCASGWDVVFEVPSEGHLRDVFTSETGDYHIVLSEGEELKEVIYTASGVETGRSDFIEPPEPGFAFQLDLRDTGKEYFSYAVVECFSSEDTVFSTVLEEVYYSDEFPGRILPSEGGGCYVTFQVEQGDEYWKLFRVDNAGDIVFETEYIFAGGPVISINDLAELPGGGVALTGVTDEYGMNLFMMLLGFDDSGESLFRRRESLRFHGYGELLGVNPEGNIVVCGITGFEREDGYFMPPADTDVFLECCTRDGELLWRTILTLPLSNWPVAMNVAPDGSVVLLVSARREDGEGEKMYFLASYTPDL